VDLLVERDGVLHPFEIKLTANPSARDLSGLSAFRRAHPHLQIGPAALLCAVERPHWITEDTAAIPWNTIRPRANITPVGWASAHAPLICGFHEEAVAGTITLVNRPAIW